MNRTLTLSPRRAPQHLPPAPAIRRARPRPPALGGFSECARIASIVAAAWGVPKERMLGIQRTRDVAIPRMVAMYLAWRTTALSTTVIGNQFGRDHTTVIAAVNRITMLCAADAELREKVFASEDRVRDAADMAVARVVDLAAATFHEDLMRAAERAFDLDPAGAAQVVRDALRAFIASKENGHE